jgi:hypothetical protein
MQYSGYLDIPEKDKQPIIIELDKHFNISETTLHLKGKQDLVNELYQLS